MRHPLYNTLLPYAHLVMQCPACGEASIEAHPDSDALICDACDQRFEGLGTAPDLAPDASGSVHGLRRLARWHRTADWTRRVGRPTLDRWVSGRDLEGRAAWVNAWLRPAAGPVLDLCTGTGFSASEVARWMGAGRVIGVDGSLELLRQTQNSPRDPGLAYVRAADDALPFRDGTIGAVHAMSGLHQAEDPLALVREAGRVLAPGGCFIGVVHVDEGSWLSRMLVRIAAERAIAREDFIDAVRTANMEMQALDVAGITAFFAARKR